MTHGSSAAPIAIAEAICALIMAKTADHLHGHPNTQNVDHLDLQFAKACVAIRTTVWVSRHGSLPLTVPDATLSRATASALTNFNLLDPRKFNSAIKKDTSVFYQLARKADQDVLWTEWWTQPTVTNVAVEIIVSSARHPVYQRTGGGLHRIRQMHHPRPFSSPPKKLVQNQQPG